MLLKELVNKYKTAQIITHTDLDGYGAGALLMMTLRKIGFDKNDIEVTHTDYSNPLPFNDKHKLVLISDISISTEDAVNKILNYYKDDKMILWFDHHKTSIDMYEKYPALKQIPGIRNTDASGTMLCWIFYQIVNDYLYLDTPTIEDIINTLNDVNISEIMNSLTHKGIWQESHFNTMSYTPIAIKLIDDYDRFILSDERSKYLMEAFNSYPKFIHDVGSHYFQKEMLGFSDKTFTTTYDFIENGKNAHLWKRIIALNSLKRNGFIGSFNGYFIKDIEMICLNSNDRGSLLFGNCYGDGNPDLIQYNYGCIYNYNGERFTVSVYCANPKKPVPNIPNMLCDASDICKCCGGGGHPGAAGFVTSILNFHNIKPLPEALKRQIDNEIEELWEKVKNISTE